MAKIGTREDLILWLTEGAELEHNLACMHLFAAFTIKQPGDLGIKGEDLVLVDGWRDNIIHVAVQEMGHLGTVNNLLAAVGGAPHFRRPNFPQPARYYPPNITFDLEAFSTSALDRFIEFEKPQPAAPKPLIAPEYPEYKGVGELYHGIKDGFQRLGPGGLFIGSAASQDRPWSPRVKPAPVTDLKSAVGAIEEIIKEGEGTDNAGPRSHYQIFTDIRRELDKRPDLEPARPVALNPMTRKHRDARDGRINLITDGNTKDVAELFNHIYDTMLLMFQRYYSFGGEAEAARNVLKLQLRMLMASLLRPLGELLTSLPIGSSPVANAGPGFEVYGDLRVPADWRISWKVIVERLDLERKEAERLAGVQKVKGAGVVLANATRALANFHDKLQAVIAGG
jgi:hypothetical protein